MKGVFDVCDVHDILTNQGQQPENGVGTVLQKVACLANILVF